MLVAIGKRWLSWRLCTLKHYGIKGMKNGMRNGPPYPIKRDGVFRNPKSINITSSNGIKVTSFAKHVADRINEDRPDRKVSTSEIVDSIKNPLYISDIRIDDKGLKSQRFIGRKATSNVNPDTGMVTSVWITGKRQLTKHRKKGK